MLMDFRVGFVFFLCFCFPSLVISLPEKGAVKKKQVLQDFLGLQGTSGCLGRWKVFSLKALDAPQPPQWGAYRTEEVGSDFARHRLRASVSEYGAALG